MSLITQESAHKPEECCRHPYTSVMIYHRGASLSEQHTDLLISHCKKQDLSCTSRYVDKSSSEIARYRIRMPTARTATVMCGYTCIN